MFKIAVIGATGYVGTEIVRLLSQHPDVEITALVSKSFAGRKFSEIYPNYKNIIDMELMDIDIDTLCEKVIFSLLLYLMKHQEILFPNLLKGVNEY